MQELYQDSGFSPVEPELRGYLGEMVEAYKIYRQEISPDDRRSVDPMLFKHAVQYCEKHKIRPVFFVHAVFNYGVGEKVSPFAFRKPEVIDRYLAWNERIPAELLDKDIESPHTVDVHRELETMAQMITTKHGRLDYESLKFKIACADIALEVTPCSRVILSEVHPLILKYYGQAYLDWTSQNKWYELVPYDFGLDHEHIKKEILNGNTR